MVTQSQPVADARAANSPAVHDAIARACASIAPAWPLDNLIAVSPLWPKIHARFDRAAAETRALSGAHLFMTPDDEAPRARPPASAHAARRSRRALFLDVLDELSPPSEHERWREIVLDRTSDLCARHFDDGQASLALSIHESLLARALEDLVEDRALASLHAHYPTLVDEFGDQPEALVAATLDELAIPPEQHASYLSALLFDVLGWASHCAYRRWSAEQRGQSDPYLVELLAVRAAWDLHLWRAHRSPAIEAAWKRAITQWRTDDERARSDTKRSIAALRAAEEDYQCSLFAALASTERAPRVEPPAAQLVFCIDVRSEPMRRAIEACDASVATLGFAGFFGLPIEHVELGADTSTPQLPGLLAPKYRATSVASEPRALVARARRAVRGAIGSLAKGAASSFAFVDAAGALFAGAFARESTGLAKGASRAEPRAFRLTRCSDGAEIDANERATLAESMLRAMSLTGDFAPIVAFIGHDTRCRNNAHEASLACGACGGHGGAINAQIAASLLEDPDVRRALAERGIAIPERTKFVWGLHETTTETVTLSSSEATEDPTLRSLSETLARATRHVRRMRAARLGLERLDDRALEAELFARASDWSEVRPEWGLANNAALVVAPRDRTRGADLDGRVFLHEYRAELDRDHAILAQIMAAPMVVAHWINMQYYASTVDPERFGSGNKTLHNVVGGHIGVLEGARGDLRIGLPLQSLHDGSRWVHTPLRLTVLIEAPAEGIDAVIERNATVRQLVENEWVLLFRITEDGTVRAHRSSRRGVGRD